MPDPVFSGVGVALVTLFDERGDLDAPATAELAAQLVDAGVRAVVVAGTTGEAAALDANERADLLAAVLDRVGDSVPVIAGTGAPSTRQAKAHTLVAVDGGAAAVLAISPAGANDLPGYYRAVRDAAGDVPLLAYHWPQASPPGIPVELLADLPVDGLKDSSGDSARLLQELRWGKPVYVGSSALLAYAGPLGCTGAILSLANVEPERCIEAFAGDTDAQRALADAHAAARESFPRRLKQMVAQRFGTSPVARI